MWLEFWRSAAIAIALLYGPGYLFFRGLRFSRLACACCAPLFSVFVYATLPIAYERLGIACNVSTMLLPTMALGILSYLVGVVRCPHHGVSLHAVPERPIAIPWRQEGAGVPFDLAAPCVYVCMASAVCAFVFVANLPSAEAFYARFDNQTHINVVRAFVDSGSWSSFSHSLYLASPLNANPLGSLASGFYPCAWHDLNAMVCVCAGSSVTVAANAVIAVLASVVFPLGMFLLLRMMPFVPRRAVLLGALATSGFCTWPWTFLVKGPCLPNVLGICLMVPLLACIVGFVEQSRVRPHAWSFGLLCAVGFCALLLSHPNTLFMAYVFMAPYGARVVWRATMAREASDTRTRAQSLLIMGAYCMAVIGFWVWCYTLPQFQGILAKDWWNKQYPPALVLRWLLLLGLAITTEQVVMLIALVAGIRESWKRACGWLVFPVAFFVLCFAASELGWQEIKYWLGGMWYMTAYRFAVCISVFAMPLVALGLDGLLRLFLRIAKPLFAFAQRRHKSFERWGAVAFIAIVLVANYWPQLPILYNGQALELSYGRMGSLLHNIYAEDVDHVYNAEEIAFVKECLKVVGPHALVINSPNDGSVWAYGVNGMNTLYRYYDIKNDTDVSKTIRTRLCEYATDPAVRSAVEELGAQYVLLLDKGVDFEDGLWIPYYSARKSAKWRGIDSIDDSTPGFTVCLAQGSQMRLYRIDR